jgi:hypothetical protein
MPGIVLGALPRDVSKSGGPRSHSSGVGRPAPRAGRAAKVTNRCRCARPAGRLGRQSARRLRAGSALPQQAGLDRSGRIREAPARHNARLMSSLPSRYALLLAALLAALLAGCSTRAVDVKPVPANPADFAKWPCDRIDDEVDRVLQRAVEVAYAVDERAGNNIVALGLGVTIFWPALVAMRPDGLEAAELARLKGRYEALRTALATKGCPPASIELPAARAAALPVAVGDRLIYEERATPRSALVETTLLLTALRRDEVEFRAEASEPPVLWRQDLAGNVFTAPAGALKWPRLVPSKLELGQVMAGEIQVSGDPMQRARVRGQVIAVGPQFVGGRRFDAAVIELFGDVQLSESSTRLEGSMVVDRAGGVLLRLDLKSAQPAFTVQRRLARVEGDPR